MVTCLGRGSLRDALDAQVYTGNCKQFEEGEKRHGIGTYASWHKHALEEARRPEVYSSGTHDVYKQRLVCTH